METWQPSLNEQLSSGLEQMKVVRQKNNDV